ncbi:hypothetical protein BGZ76_009830 [Entomortierella beljakovae]|nr:hypothetical protein BGZ76_009830 [Entomortierella beljakovae]
MFKRPQNSKPFGGIRDRKEIWPPTAHPAQAIPKERQTVIDGYFEHIYNKQRQRSQYFEDPDLLSDEMESDKLDEIEIDCTNLNEQIHQAVPTSPMLFSNSNYDGRGSTRAHVVPSVYQTESRMSFSASSGNISNDPAKVYAGGVRRRSIQFAPTICYVTNNLESRTMPILRNEGSKVALVEVIGRKPITSFHVGFSHVLSELLLGVYGSRSDCSRYCPEALQISISEDRLDE